MQFLYRPPQIIRKIYPDALWRKIAHDPTIYLTFDDGPIPELTPWVIDILAHYNIKATFFCVGENIKKHSEKFLTFTMPVREKEYVDKRLFQFFDGLIPEGWLLNIASKNWKINTNDRMGLLLACCENCIGAASVKPIPEKNE